MPLGDLDCMTLEQCRAFYAEEIRVVSRVDSMDLVEAFARVPRERFLGAPPWHIHSGQSVKQAGYRATSNVRDLYHDVFVALKPTQFLNNGQPSLIARLLSALNLAPGRRVLHIGCGTGYYSALMAEVVGPKGSIIAVEVEDDLALQAAANLIGYEQVAVLHQDGAAVDPGTADAILVNAAVTNLRPAWLASLTDRGVLVLPLSVGRSPRSNDALVVVITRRGNCYEAELLLLMTIYSSPSMRDPAIQALLNDSLESRAITRLRSVRTDAHDRSDSCIVHAAGFCLSAEPAEPSE
jgi:protein-L-isoaspartate(D-aspartate) O-methyltransferase